MIKIVILIEKMNLWFYTSTGNNDSDVNMAEQIPMILLEFLQMKAMLKSLIIFSNLFIIVKKFVPDAQVYVVFFFFLLNII